MSGWGRVSDIGGERALDANVDADRRMWTLDGSRRQRPLTPGPPACETPIAVILVRDERRVDTALATGALACPRCAGSLRRLAAPLGLGHC
jgi:hypothetical protein